MTMKSRYRFVVLALAVAVAGCGSTGHQEFQYPMFAQGSTAPTTAGTWTVTVDVATIALGPIYFCATQAASMSLCPVAVSEFADVATIDALAANVPLGTVDATPGLVQSAQYDWGITWFPRQTEATATPEAPGGHSAHLEGHATNGTTLLRFISDVDIEPTIAGTHAVQGARTESDVRSANARLDVGLTPGSWFERVDFDELAAIGADPVNIAAGTRAYDAIHLRMMAIAAPTFNWTITPAGAP
jgi:hypothetical protein